MEFFEIDETKTIYELNSGKYKKIKTLGEGAFGKVLLVEKLSPENEITKKKDSYYFALKISKRFQKKSKTKKNSKDEPEKIKEVPQEINFVELRELMILKKLKIKTFKSFKFS